MSFLHKMSKKVHCYLGLFLSLFLVWMSVSGILLNHPDLISRVSMPLKAMPGFYEYKNWNRYSFRDAVFSKKNADRVFVCGKQGVWQSLDNGRTFSAMDNGFPEPAWQKDTFCLLPTENGDFLYAGTRTGLYVCKLATSSWSRVKGVPDIKIISLFQNGDKAYAFTSSGCFSGEIEQDAFSPVLLPLPGNMPADLSISRFLLSLHDGSILGLPGKLGVDLLAAVLIFFCLSGIYLWVVSRNLKRFKGRKKVFKAFRFCHKYHLKFGIWCALFLIVITATGFLLKPPFRMLIYKNFGAKISIADKTMENPWKDQIFKVVFLPEQKSILMSTRQGFYMAPVNLDAPFKKQVIPVKISGMGTTVLKLVSGHHLLTGSFSGLFSVDLETKELTRGFTGAQPGRKHRSMICGALVKDGRLIGYAGYRKGFIKVAANDSISLSMPDALTEKAKISLWYGLFELHNTRLFTFLTHTNTWLIIPIAGILTLIILLSGCFDWYYKKVYIKRSRR